MRGNRVCEVSLVSPTIGGYSTVNPERTFLSVSDVFVD